MPFDLRCPDCRAKLRLDEKPGRDDPVECPKCGGTFTPAEAAAAEKGTAPANDSAAEAKPKKKPAGPPKEREGKERTFFNPFAALAIVLVGLAVYVGVCWFILHTLGKSGRVEDMVAFIPKDCNLLRGASLQTLNRYPGYREELDRYVPPPIRSALEALAKANGGDPADFLDYMVYGKVMGPNKTPSLTVFAFRCKVDLDPAALKGGLSATDDPAKCLRMPATAPGILAGALVDLPTNRHIVIAPRAGNTDQAKAITGSRAGAADREQSFVGHLGDTGRVVIRGHGWVLLRAVGAQEKVFSSYAEPLKEGLATLSERLKTAKIGGLWNSFGGSIRFGGALDCQTSSAAYDLAKSLKNGPLGSDDMDIPRSLKSTIYVTANKEFGAFRSDFSFRSQGTCAYYTTGMQGDGAKAMLNHINIQTIGDGGAVSTGGS